jgi:hypothetical protein
MEIIDLPIGEKVTEPGFYRTPLSWYHSTSFCDGPSISSSMARSMFPDLRFGICPAHFWAFWKGNPDAPKQDEDPEWAAFGSAAHALILGDENFEENYVVRPVRSDFPDALETMADMRAYLDGNGAPHKASDTKDILIDRCQDEDPEVMIWSEILSEFERRRGNRRVISSDDFRAIQAMSQSLAGHPAVQAGLLEGQAEISIVARDPVTGIFLKSRLDNLPANAVQTDLKTTGFNLPGRRQREITDKLYFAQLAWGRMVRRLVDGVVATENSIIFVGKPYPHFTTWHPIGSESLGIGDVLNRAAINAFAHGLGTGEWPGYETEINYQVPETIGADISGDTTP